MNVAVVVFLVVAKRLFGVRGGRMALEESGTDYWSHVIEHPADRTWRDREDAHGRRRLGAGGVG